MVPTQVAELEGRGGRCRRVRPCAGSSIPTPPPTAGTARIRAWNTNPLIAVNPSSAETTAAPVLNREASTVRPLILSLADHREENYTTSACASRRKRDCRGFHPTCFAPSTDFLLIQFMTVLTCAFADFRRRGSRASSCCAITATSIRSGNAGLEASAEMADHSFC